MLHFYMTADEMYKCILNYCRNQGWVVLSNEEQKILGVHFRMGDITEEVSIKVHDDKNIVVINTMLPVLCRRENIDSLKLYLQEINEKDRNSFGHFQMEGRRIVYVYAFAYEGDVRFNEKAFAVYMDACIMVPYLSADGILDVATDYVSLPPFNPEWADLEREIFRDPIVTDPEDTIEFDALDNNECPADDLASWRETFWKHKIPPEDW